MIIMAKETIGLSRELIIHPGETLAEAIEDREMSQHELAVRTGMTDKHISTVIIGQKNISPSFAKKLEYALGINASFWMNLQNNYDQELLEFEELNNIRDEELSIVKKLKNVTDVYTSIGFLQAGSKPVELVLDYRKLFGISNLSDIPKISYFAAYRAQIRNTNIDPYVLYAWQRMCELLTLNTPVDQVDIKMLKERIPEIKNTMFMRPNQIPDKLSDIFSQCGIAFKIVPCFTGAPVQGFIKKTGNGPIILCITLRQKFADIFWFTLFHEIAHIINGDTKRQFIDMDSLSGTTERKADMFARDSLINSVEYDAFVAAKGYERRIEIQRFAQSQNVKDFVVLGRLMNDKYIPWGDRPRYDWA